MCCFFTVLLFFGPRLAVLVWWLIRPLYIQTGVSGNWILAILALIFLPWTFLMYLIVYPGGIIGFDWLWLGLGLLADLAGWFGGARHRDRVPGYPS